MVHDLELTSVGKTYPDGTVAVSDFDLAVEKGEFVAFLGPSGCGKSTTLRMIAGFEDITNGSIKMMGQDMTHVPPESRPTSMIFQSYALFPHMTVRENVRFGLDIKGLSKAEKNAKVDRILDMFDLEGFADRKADKLSGGQRQRIALARGLVVEPEILLLDEPLGALDANLRRIIQNELKLLQRELGITFVFVTHAQSEALGLSDRVVVMSNGVVEQISPPQELYRRPQTPFVADFIGSNTVFRGTPRGTGIEGFGRLETPVGILEGVGNGTETLAAIPAEAFHIKPANAAQDISDDIRFSGTLSDRQFVGAVGHLKVRLADDREVAVEVSADHPELCTLDIGAPVTLGVAPTSVTLIQT